jgi:hypothetical protein
LTFSGLRLLDEQTFDSLVDPLSMVGHGFAGA